MKLLNKNILVYVLAILGFMSFSNVSMAAERATKEEAVAMVKKAVAFYKKNGREKSLAAFSDQSGQFRDRELFLIVLDPTGLTVAHTALKRMIGANIMELKDQNGVEIVKSFYKAVEKSNSGWSVEYIFINPATQQLEPKMTYIEKVDDLLIACGYHYLKK
jgi:signal transduction histidine kinase